MSSSSDRSPPAYRGRSMCLAAPAEAGQRVDTLSVIARQHLEAERTLAEMQKDRFRRGEFDSAECEALSIALFVVGLHNEARGYRA